MVAVRVLDEIGLDIDAKFMAKKLAEKAIRLMMFYIMEVRDFSLLPLLSYYHTCYYDDHTHRTASLCSL